MKEFLLKMAGRLKAAMPTDQPRSTMLGVIEALEQKAEMLIAGAQENTLYSIRHKDDVGVIQFSLAMRDKMEQCRTSKGRWGWENKSYCEQQKLSDMLHDCVEKGDPIDVANFCMMLHQRGEAILPYTRQWEPTIV